MTQAAAEQPGRARRTFCRLCPALCAIEVTGDRDDLRVSGDRNHLLSHGYTCPKGRRLAALVDDPHRIDTPMLRGRSGRLLATDWETALDDLAGRLDGIRARAGADAVGTYSGTMLDSAGRTLMERLRRSIGSSSRYTSATVDSIDKVLVPKLMAGREGLVPAVDFERTTLLIVIGENTVVSHGAFSYFPDPVRRLREVARRGELWVIDPRRTETSRLGTRHLRPRSGTDFAVVGHLVRELLGDGADAAYLADHTRNVEDLRDAVERFDERTTVEQTGLAPEDLRDLVAAVRRHRRVAVVTGTGVTMANAGSVTEWLVFALQIVTGSFERPGGRWFNHSTAFRPGRDRAADTSGFGPGPKSRPELRRFADQHPCAVLASEIEENHVEALMVVGGNPLVAFPQPERLDRAFQRLGVLAVWDIVPSATAERATHVLPCPSALERADLVTPVHLSAVYTQYTPPVVPLRGECRPMWWSIGHLARRLGFDVLDGMDPDACTDDDVFAAMAAPTGLAWDELRQGAPIPGEHIERWVEETVLPDGRWDLAPAPLVERLHDVLRRPVPTLVLGNRREVHHTNSTLTWALPERVPATAGVHMSKPDAVAAGVADGDEVQVRSPHGSLTGVVRVDADLPTGVVNVPHGFSAPNVGRLTSDEVEIDPLSGMPTLVGVPVTVVPIR